ncbi:hypothetical protein D030_3382A, partial [Vibrio parahaemolyticus AQ3810]
MVDTNSTVDFTTRTEKIT